MAEPHINKELEELIARTERSRIQVRQAWEKFEHLEAAIDSLKEAQERAKSALQKMPKGNP